jgi:hypothetical protein
VAQVKDEHVQMYVDDAMALFKEQIEPKGMVNINVLNSMTLMFCNSLRLDELE